MKINRIQNYLIFNAILVLSLITSACSKETKHFNELDCNNEEINDHTAAIFIIPEVGCGTCIANGINFLKENEEIFKTNRDRYLIVLSNIHSLKMVKHYCPVKI